VIEASDVRSAVDHLCSQTVDVLCVDVELPGVSGFARVLIAARVAKVPIRIACIRDTDTDGKQWLTAAALQARTCPREELREALRRCPPGSRRWPTSARSSSD
jgi:DNA-binding response OmpR family regulator